MKYETIEEAMDSAKAILDKYPGGSWKVYREKGYTNRHGMDYYLPDREHNEKIPVKITTSPREAVELLKSIVADAPEGFRYGSISWNPSEKVPYKGSRSVTVIQDTKRDIPAIQVVKRWAGDFAVAGFQI